MSQNWKWRNYQNDCFKSIIENYQKGIKQQLIVQATGCHAKGQKILMYNGRFKLVEDIKIGDVLMGDDSTHRTVLQLYQGKEEMVRIIPVKGEPFVVNLSHILSLKKTPTPGKYSGMKDIVNISVREYLNTNPHFKHLYKLYRVPVNFTKDFYDDFKIVNPYLVGLWLGDGSTANPMIVSNDPETDQYLNSLDLIKSKIHKGNGLYAYHLQKGHRRRGGVENRLYSELTYFVVNGLKSVSNRYLCYKENQRLEMLAGLIDSDGSLVNDGCCYDFINKNKSIADAVCFLARSVGLRASFADCKKRCVNTDTWGDYFRVTISGNTDIIPCKIQRKKANPRFQKKNVLVTGFKLEHLPIDDYYGFGLNGNKLYCLSDFTVTHNCGKRSQAVYMAGKAKNQLFLAHTEELIEQAFNEFVERYGFMNVGMIRGNRMDLDKRFVVSSPQTLHNRLDKIPRDHFAMVQLDEVHRYLAKTFYRVVDHFDCKLRLGWTATPRRLDGLSLMDMFQERTFEFGILEGIRQGYLTELKGIKIATNINISNVGKAMGDFKTGELEALVDIPERNKLIVDSYEKHARERQFICFAVDTHHAVNIAKEFTDRGYNVAVISSDKSVCSDTDRDQRISTFKKGEILGLANVNILTEGFDYKDVGAILDAAPTLSEARYLQRVGRGTRRKSEEFVAKHGQNCLVMDFVDLSSRHRLVNSFELDRTLPASEKVFVTKEDRDKLFEAERKRREAKVVHMTEKDEYFDFTKPPKVKISTSDKMMEEVTPAQLNMIAKFGLYDKYDEDGNEIEYTKKNIAELLETEILPWMKKKMVEWRYNPTGASIAQFLAISKARKIEEKEKESQRNTEEMISKLL